MPQPLADVLAEVRELLLAPGLTRAVAAGRRRGFTPSVTRAELRPVELKAGPKLQIVTDDGARPTTRNVTPGAEAAEAVDGLLAEPFGNWHVETSSQTVQVRITKKGDAQVHRAAAASAAAPAAAALPDGRLPQDRPSDGQLSQDRLSHDRVKQWLLDPGDPLFAVIGGNAAKRRQIDAFLRALQATLPAELPPSLRVVDLGCGNAYLTFAAYRYLAGRGVSVQVVGVDVREDQRVRNSAVAAELGCSADVTFVTGTIADAELPFAPDLVLALHACDTATDQALARAVSWSATWILAAPCCHHDIAAQLKGRPAPSPFGELTRHAIMRERFADVLTDSLRASLLRLNGYKVDVVEFIDSAHTPRNLMLRSRQTGAAPTEAQRKEYDALITEWGVTPALSTMLG